MSRELLELAARAMGYMAPLQRLIWQPDTHSGDAAEMCAALGIGTDWYYDNYAIRDINAVACQRVSVRSKRIEFMEYLTDHNNDRAAAWRMAALRVAAEIGGGDEMSSLNEIRAALAEYDPQIEWTDDAGDFPLIDEGDFVQWEIHADGIVRSEGCYQQQCDFMPRRSIADIMCAMDAASKALNDYLRDREAME